MGGATQYAVSDSGTLVYMPGTSGWGPPGSQRTLIWVDRNGKEEPIATPPNAYGWPGISPDGTRVALMVTTASKPDIWIWSLARKTLTRLTFDAYLDVGPLWTPDSKQIVYLSANSTASIKVCRKAADGTGKIESIDLSSANRIPIPSSWSDKGKTLISSLIDANSIGTIGDSNTLGFDIGALSMEGDQKQRPLLKEKYSEVQPKISPDGRWMAYTSNESGQNQVYVRPYPDVEGGRWQVSTGGGDSPLWSSDGRELFYRIGDEVMAVSIQTKPVFNIETPKSLFHGKYASADFSFQTLALSAWDISPDGKRFLMMKDAQGMSGNAAASFPRRLNIVLNWFEELKQRVPTK
jgi:serine/threonine-protein kinase